MRTKRVVLVLTVALFLVGCGGDDSTADETSGPLEDAVRSYTSAFLGDESDEAFSLLTARCQDQIDEDDFADIVASASDMFGDAEIASYDEQIDGESAMVTYELSVSELDQNDERWLQEDGEWRNDDC